MTTPSSNRSSLPSKLTSLKRKGDPRVKPPPPQTNQSTWTPEEIAFVKSWYAVRIGSPADRKALAGVLGRPLSTVAKQVARLELAESKRKGFASTGGHPKGQPMHPEVKQKLREGNRAWWGKLSPSERTQRALDVVSVRVQKYGTGRVGVATSNAYSRTKSGKREDLGGLFLRSTWEANYARYLNRLTGLNEIQGWEYEADTFVFEAVKRGTRTYTPDFKVTNRNGPTEYHEVKGWMDDASKTRLSQMAKYYPDVKIILIAAPIYRALAKHVKNLVPNWEKGL